MERTIAAILRGFSPMSGDKKEKALQYGECSPDRPFAPGAAVQIVPSVS
jgi:hypothetical protein